MNKRISFTVSNASNKGAVNLFASNNYYLSILKCSIYESIPAGCGQLAYLRPPEK